jgi:hypothetical protein
VEALVTHDTGEKAKVHAMLIAGAPGTHSYSAGKINPFN